MPDHTHPRRIEEIDWSIWRPMDSDTLLFVVRQRQVLLIRKKRGLGAGKINGPGGKIDPGESALECALRETREEIGIRARQVEKRAELRFDSDDFGRILGHVFVARDFDGTPVETAEAVPIWFDADRLPYHEMWEDDIYWLPHVLFGKRLCGEFLFTGESLLDYRIRFLADGDDW